MTDSQIADMLAAYHKECDAAETLREKGDIQLKHARLIRLALQNSSLVQQPEKCILHSTDWHGKCFKCGEQVFVRESK